MMAVDGRRLTLEEIARVALGDEKAKLSTAARKRMDASRKVVERIIAKGKVVYGINTGFGRLSNVVIPNKDLGSLQLNLVRSHACGVGEPLSESETRAMLLLSANTLALGYSGARPEVAELLIEFLNAGITPVVPSKGSVGASGDLAPLAHLALALIGEGEAVIDGATRSGRSVFKGTKLQPLTLEAKEGLALVNGTQAMLAVGSLALLRAERISFLANVSGAMTLEALRDTPAAFDERIQDARPHRGQRDTAAHLRKLMVGSEIRESHRENDPRVQDAYSLRCMPQVHGAIRDVLAHAREILETESGSATDNPLVFAEKGDVISGGNFHGAPLAYCFDYASIALTDLASICERRIERLVNPDLSEGLPAFLTKHAGKQSGFMLAQIAAAALLSECRVLAHPASVDNVPTSGGKEDHVSMGMTSALKFRQIVENVERVLAIELLCAAQGLEFRKPLKPGKGVLSAYKKLRTLVPKVEHDRALGKDIELLAKSIREGNLD